jgi:hypothetical protein
VSVDVDPFELADGVVPEVDPMLDESTVATDVLGVPRLATTTPTSPNAPALSETATFRARVTGLRIGRRRVTTQMIGPIAVSVL